MKLFFKTTKLDKIFLLNFFKLIKERDRIEFDRDKFENVQFSFSLNFTLTARTYQL